MGWDQQRHPVEMIVVTASLAIFAGGLGLAAWLALRQPAIAGAAALAALLLGWAILERADGRWRDSPRQFVPAEYGHPEEYLPTNHSDEGVEELLLDDPLSSPTEKSRVVSLFEPAAVNATPGELVDRIGDYLEGRTAQAILFAPPSAPDASAELYAALANIRASLR
jgi:hypothetical protein